MTTVRQLPEVKRREATVSYAVYPAPVCDSVRLLVSTNYADAGGNALSLPDDLFVVGQRRLSKAVAAWMYRTHGVKLSTAHGEAIGTIAAKYAQFAIEYDVTNVFQWQDGDFGDKGACMFGGCYNESRVDYLPRLGASALRFYTARPGRCWIIPVPHEYSEGRNWYVVTNYYGDCSQTDKVRGVMRSLLAELLGGTWGDKRVDLRSSDNTLYINGGNKYLFAPTVDLADVPTCLDITGDHADESGIARPDWAIDDDYAPALACTDCGHRLHEDNAHYSDWGAGPFCDDCYNDRFSWCERCENECSNDDTQVVTDANGHEHTWCDHCASRYAQECRECGTTFATDMGRWGSGDPVDMVTDADGDCYCQDCADEHLRYCEVCEEHHHSRYTSFTDARDARGHYVTICESCVDGYAATCPECDTCNLIESVDGYRVAYTVEVDGEHYCEGCAPETDEDEDEGDASPPAVESVCLRIHGGHLTASLPMHARVVVWCLPDGVSERHWVPLALWPALDAKLTATNNECSATVPHYVSRPDVDWWKNLRLNLCRDAIAAAVAEANASPVETLALDIAPAAAVINETFERIAVEATAMLGSLYRTLNLDAAPVDDLDAIVDL